MTVQTFTDATAVQEPWLRLAGQLPSPMETFEWTAACSSSLVEDGTLRLVTVTHGDRLISAAQMQRVGRGLGARLEHIGVTRLAEPMDLAAANDEGRTALADALVATGLPFTLDRVRADSATAGAIQTACRRRRFVIRRRAKSYPFIPLDDSWIRPEWKISASRRGAVRRAWRNAGKLGPVSTQIFCPTPDEVDSIMDVAMDVESSSWKGEEGVDMAANRPIGDFFRDYARFAAATGSLRVCFLNIDGAVAAMQIGAVHADSFWVLKVGYDPEFRKASPGILLMVEAIKYAVAHGLRTYELLGFVESWTEVWTRDERDCVALRVYPPNLRGVYALIKDTLRAAASRLIRRIR